MALAPARSAAAGIVHAGAYALWLQGGDIASLARMALAFLLDTRKLMLCLWFYYVFKL